MSTVGRPEANTLPPGTSRLGFVIDGSPDTPEMSCLLENDGQAIQLTIPFTGEFGHEYRRWFEGEETSYEDDPDKSKYSYEIPDCLEFHDHLGHLTLVGCSTSQ